MKKITLNSLRNDVHQLITRYLGKQPMAEKEKAIFEKLVSRRDFLKGTAKLALLTGLMR